jgi:hypothetical protein
VKGVMQYHVEKYRLKPINQRRFDTDKQVIELTILAYNMLRILGQESLKGIDEEENHV